MKKIIIGLLVIVIIIATWIGYNEYSFSPLTQKEFKKLFSVYHEEPVKLCSKDFLGISSKGELFEVYLYQVNGVALKQNFSDMIAWEDKSITGSSIVCSWKKCPLDSQATSLYNFTLTAENFDSVECLRSFNKDKNDPKNYYSFVHFNEQEQYFMLYCVDKQELYYIRRRGF